MFIIAVMLFKCQYLDLKEHCEVNIKVLFDLLNNSRRYFLMPIEHGYQIGICNAG